VRRELDGFHHPRLGGGDQNPVHAAEAIRRAAESGDVSDHTHDHDHHAHDVEGLAVAVLTVSSSRTLDDDPAGDALAAAVADAGHEVVTRDLVTDDHDAVRGRLTDLVGDDAVGAVVTTGGTGVTPDDVTVEAATALFDKDLPGFGELFRRRSYDEVGTRVVGTRATAGVAGGVPVFCLPGSENAARLGADLVVAEAPHLAGLAGRGVESDEE
jgi:molybdenum cofactor biosynthesis protein B